MNVVISLGLIALGMSIDAVYQHKIRVAECDAFETGYQQGRMEGGQRPTNESDCKQSPSVASTRPCGAEWPEKENTIHKEITVPDVPMLPSMDAPVEMPPTFEERLKKHGRAVVRLK